MVRKILVTGGLGFIGSHTVVELMAEGYDIVILDNLFNSSLGVLDRIAQITGKKPRFYECDILDIPAMERVFQQEKNIQGVIHFAALKAVGESVEKPLWYYENNVVGTLNLLKVMEKFGCKRIVFSSSATVYGMDNQVPFTESMATSATNPYGYSKVSNERFLMDMAAVDPSFSPAILRYFNPIGAHESGLLGEDPNGIPNNLLPYIMQVAVGKLEHLNVFGQDYPTPDGTGLRDYIHVVDLAKGHVAAVKHIFEKNGLLLVNLGTGIGSSVLEVVKATEKACGKAIPMVFAPRRDGDIATCYAKTDYAKEVLGWEATKKLEDMCRDSWRFMEKTIQGDSTCKMEEKADKSMASPSGMEPEKVGGSGEKVVIFGSMHNLCEVNKKRFVVGTDSGNIVVGQADDNLIEQIIIDTTYGDLRFDCSAGLNMEISDVDGEKFNLYIKPTEVDMYLGETKHSVETLMAHLEMGIDDFCHFMSSFNLLLREDIVAVDIHDSLEDLSLLVGGKPIRVFECAGYVLHDVKNVKNRKIRTSATGNQL